MNQEQTLHINSNVIARDASENNKQEKTLQLKIELDSWSPVYTNF